MEDHSNWAMSLPAHEIEVLLSFYNKVFCTDHGCQSDVLAKHLQSLEGTSLQVNYIVMAKYSSSDYQEGDEGIVTRVFSVK